MTNMATMPIHGKNFYKFLLLNQWIDCLEIWYIALDTRVYQDCSNNDLGLTLAYVTTRSNMEKF